MAAPDYVMNRILKDHEHNYCLKLQAYHADLDAWSYQHITLTSMLEATSISRWPRCLYWFRRASKDSNPQQPFIDEEDTEHYGGRKSSRPNIIITNYAVNKWRNAKESTWLHISPWRREWNVFLLKDHYIEMVMPTLPQNNDYQRTNTSKTDAVMCNGNLWIIVYFLSIICNLIVFIQLYY